MNALLVIDFFSYDIEWYFTDIRIHLWRGQMLVFVFLLTLPAIHCHPLPTHFPQGHDWNSPQTCKSGMTNWRRVMCATERYWASSGNFDNCQQTVTLFRHVSWQEKSSLLFFIIHDNKGVLTGIERYSREWRWFRCLISLAWFWYLTGRTRLDFLIIQGIINEKWGFPSIFYGHWCRLGMTCCERGTDVRERFGKIRPFRLIFNDLLHFSSCHMARMVVIDFIWYWVIVEYIQKFVFTLTIQSPRMRYWSSPQTCKSGMTNWRRVMCATERYWASSGNFALFSTNCHIISSFFMAGKIVLAFSIIHDNKVVLTGIERYSRDWRWFRCLISLAWFWYLTWRTRLDFRIISGNNKRKMRFPVYILRTSMSIRDGMLRKGSRMLESDLWEN